MKCSARRLSRPWLGGDRVAEDLHVLGGQLRILVHADPQRVEHGGDAGGGDLGVMGVGGRGRVPAHLRARRVVALEMVGVKLDQAGQQPVALEIDARRRRSRHHRLRRSTPSRTTTSPSWMRFRQNDPAVSENRLAHARSTRFCDGARVDARSTTKSDGGSGSRNSDKASMASGRPMNGCEALAQHRRHRGAALSRNATGQGHMKLEIVEHVWITPFVEIRAAAARSACPAGGGQSPPRSRGARNGSKARTTSAASASTASRSAADGQGEERPDCGQVQRRNHDGRTPSAARPQEPPGCRQDCGPSAIRNGGLRVA